MSGFRIQCEFEKGRGVVREHRASWGRLEIWIGDNCTTRFQDLGQEELRHGIFRPMYPLAEWILANWWALGYEPRREFRRGYWKRHNLRAAEEGFAAPDLEFSSLGDVIELRWRPHRCPEQRVEFLESGVAQLPRADVQAELLRFVERVVNRLDKRRVAETFVQKEFTSLQPRSDEELEFCRAAGALGLDPFQIDDAPAQIIENATSILAKPLHEEVFAVASIGSLNDLVATACSAVADSASHEFIVDSLQSHAHSKSFAERISKPWKAGYERAITLSKAMALDDDGPPVKLDRFCKGLEDFAQSQTSPMSSSWLDVLGHSVSDRVLGLSCLKQRRESRRFAVTRAIGDFLSRDKNELFVVTSSNSSTGTKAVTYRQQFNRAFAAELLAPARSLAKRLRNDQIVDDEQIHDLAALYQVSEFVILWQLQNHRLAANI